MFDKHEQYQLYLDKEMRYLKTLTNGIIHSMGYPYTEMCIEDFYDVALVTLWRVVENYDEEKCDKFEPYLRLCLRSKFKTYKNANFGSSRTADKLGKKRVPASLCMSTELPIADNGLYLEDILVSDNDVFEEAFGEVEDDVVTEYRNSLSKIQRKLLDLVISGYNAVEIQNALHISPASYRNHYEAITRNGKILYERKREVYR